MDETKRIVTLDDDQLVTWCSPRGGHVMKEVDLEKTTDGKRRQGDCPSCNRRYVSAISPDKWQDPQGE